MALSHCLSRFDGFLLLMTTAVHFTGEPGMPCPFGYTDHVGITFKAHAECFSRVKRLLGFRQTRRAKFSEEASLRCVTILQKFHKLRLISPP